jgi:hypothetical protein
MNIRSNIVRKILKKKTTRIMIKLKTIIKKFISRYRKISQTVKFKILRSLFYSYIE